MDASTCKCGKRAWWWWVMIMGLVYLSMLLERVGWLILDLAIDAPVYRDVLARDG